MAKVIFEIYPKRLNLNFIQSHTADFSAYQKTVENTDWFKIESQSGLSREQLTQAAEIFVNSNSVISCWAMGLTQHKHSVDTIKEVVNLHLLTGQIAKPGAGLCPVRGHSNVQGNRTVGINEKPSAEFIKSLEANFNQRLPYSPGHNVYQALKALHNKQSKVLICLGGNLAQAASDTHFTHQAIKSAELNVQISTKLNRSHLLVSEDALILPCLGRSEKDEKSTGLQKITVEDTFSMVHASTGMTEPVSQFCLSETEIIAQIANAVLPKSLNWLELKEDYRKIRDLMARTLNGFENFNLKIEQPTGFHLTNSAAELNWQTNTQKAHFNSAMLPENILSDCYQSEQRADDDRKNITFVLQSLRSHDQYNTTIYGLDDRYRGIQGKRSVVFINAEDAAQLSLTEGQAVDIRSSCNQGITREVQNFTLVFYDIPRGNLAAYYPETNPLLSIESVGEYSYTPTSKSIPVTISPTTSKNLTITSI